MASRDVTRNALFGLAKLVVLLGVLLFVPAWSLDFWQAWGLGSVLLACSLLITLYFLKRDPKLIERRLKAGPIAEKEPSQKIIQALAMLFFILVIVVPGIDHRFRWSDVPAPLVIVGDFFVGQGFLIYFLVCRENSFASATLEVGQDQKVISSGPYRVVRHPMYAGGLLMFLFIPLGMGSYWGLLFVPPMIVVIIWRLLSEERFLIENLPGYDEYRKNTRYRLVPLVW